MSPVVVGRESSKVSHPRGHGHWWTAETLYLHSLLHDPFILSRIQHLPCVVTEDQIQVVGTRTLLFYAQPVTSADYAGLIQQVLAGGGAAVLNQPDATVLGSLPALNWATAGFKEIESLRERWDLNTARTYYYADRQCYGCYDPTHGKVLSWIGDHPDLIVQGQTAVFAGNPWSTILAYLNTPIFGRLLLDVADLLVRVTALFVGDEVGTRQTQQMARHSELRRDFHAFGFAIFAVEQLELSLGVSRVNLQEARAAAIEAANELTSGNAAQSQSTLRNAFRLLERENRKLQPEPAIFTDTLHGGGLFNDIGFCEFDWPQHAADVLANHLDWVETRSYRLNIDFAAKSLEHLGERFPRLFSRLRAAQDRGQVEMVNGTWNQPYPPFFTLESVIRQFDLGGDTMEKILGRRPVSFASQEFSFAPQLASVLAQQGFQGVVLRAQNMGDAPVINANLVNWAAPNGDRILALPSHAYKSEHLNEVTYNNLHLKLFASAHDGPNAQVFTGLGDLTYYRPFREELARTAHYANVFGRFWTWDEYFSAQGQGSASQELRANMEDFDCRAAFLEIERWQHLRWTGGGSIAHCMRSTKASELFRAAEILDTLTSRTTHVSGLPHQEHWRSLATFQGHDRYFSPDWPVGGFMGAAFNPTRRTGCIEQTVADYCGPIDTTTIGHRAGRELQVAEKRTRRWIRDRLRPIDKQIGLERKWVLYNPGPAKQAVVRFRALAGLSVQIAERQIPCQNDGDDLLALASLPAYSCSAAVFTDHDSALRSLPKNSVQCGEGHVDNGLIRVEFNPRDGVITRVLRSLDGRLLLVDGHRFGTRDSGPQCCEKVVWRVRSPLKALVDFTISIPMPGGAECRIAASLSLEAGQSWFQLRHRILACPPIRGDQWEEHLGLQFTLADERFTLQRSHYNVLEPASSTRIFSHNLLLADVAGQAQVAWVNHGNQFYVRNGRSITTLLLCENETAPSFSHYLGCPGQNPMAEARAFVSPLFIYPCGGAGSPSGVSSDARAIELDCDEVELLSFRQEAIGYRVRLASLSRQPLSARVRLREDISEAWLTNLAGKRRTRAELSEGRAIVPLRPWDIVQLELRTALKELPDRELP